MLFPKSYDITLAEFHPILVGSQENHQLYDIVFNNMVVSRPNYFPLQSYSL